MRKIYIVILSLLSIFVFNSRLNAQLVGTYVFVPSAGTYTALTGATASTAAGDDGTEGGIPIGFNFVYGGITATHVAITTNGFIRLGNSAAVAIIAGTPNYDNSNFGASTNQPLIAPLWDDNNATGGSIVYVTAGAVGSRTFSVEWINMHMGGGGSTTTPTGSFKVTLSETSNIITMVYGTINALTASTASIGLNDATTFLSVTPGATATASSITVNNNITSAANLTSGTTYTFFPPPPCVPGSLAGGTTQSTVVSACPGVPFTLSVTSASIGTGLTYQWESSTDNTNWFPVAGATAQGLTTSTLVTTYYRRKMTCAGTDAYSSSLLITISAPLPLPVTEGFNTSGNNVFPTCWRQQFVVGTGNITFETASVNPATVPFEGTRYAYWNSFGIGNGNETRLVSPAIVTTGTPSVDVQFYWFNENSPFYTTLLEGVQVQYSLNGTTWIDAGSFIPRQDVSLAAGGPGQWKIKKITLPAAAGNQASIFVGFKFHSVFGDNCSMDAVNILASPSCVEPPALTVTAVTPTTVTLSWTAATPNPASGYEWEIRTSGAGGSGAAGLVTSNSTTAGVTSVNVTGLTPSTTYSYYVRSNCGAGFSIWAGPFTFTTLCNLSTLPLNEGFNTSGTAVFPNCWTQQFVVGTGNITFQTASTNPATVPFEGTRFAYWNSFSIGSGNETRLVSPGIVTTGTPSVDVQFYWFNENSAFYTTLLEGVQVQYSLNGTTWVDAGIFIPRQDVSLAVGGAGQWKIKKVTLPAAAGNQPVIYVGFKFHSVFGDNCSMDAVNILASPSCVEPSGLTVTNVIPTAAILSWTASPSNPANGYQWEVRTSGAAGSGATGLATSGITIAGATSVTAGGLTPNTAYNYYVRSDCGAGTFSIWSGGFAFTTPCNPLAIPFTETFATYATTFPPTCWTRNNATYLIGLAPSAYGIGTGSAKFDFFNAAAGTNLDLISQLFTPVPANYQLVFDHAYSSYAGEIDQLQILYSTNSGASYTNLITYPGGPNGPLNTFGGSGNTTTIFSPTAAQWAKKQIMLPVGTNRLMFRGVSAFGNNLFLDNISVKAIPLVDVGITGITLPAINCPTNGVLVQATIKNYNLLPENFATYPVTVTANITGAATSTLTALINTGTLAPGASMSVNLSPTFSFSTGGTYNITVATSTNPASNDPETTNDSYSTSVVVNPSPPTPVITPPAPAICAGNPVLLSTQFTVSPPVITWTPVTGLYTNAAATTAYSGANAFSLYAKPAATTTYTVTATTAAGCTAASTVRVTVNPNPVIVLGGIPDTVCISDPLIPLNIQDPIGGSWTGTGVSGNNFVPPATAVGTYTLTYSFTNSFGCTSTATKKIVVKDCPERIILLRDNALTLYPNPNNGKFNIRINSVLYNNLGMRVYTNSGVLVRTQQIGGLAWGRIVPIDLSNLPGGLYMVKFTYESGVRTSEKTFKVVIGTE